MCLAGKKNQSGKINCLLSVRDNFMLDLKLKMLFSKPLTFVNEKNQKKEAVSVFKLVQIYMSDRKAKVRI